MSWWTPDRQAYALAFLVNNAGLTPLGAAGLVSRWKNVEAPNGPASRGGYLGRAWGIGQWLGARLPPINGNPDFDAQLNYVAQELDSTEARAAALLRSAATVNEAARAATAYERAGGWNAATNTDNFTGQTAAGIAAVLQNYSGGAPAPVQTADVLNSPDTIEENPDTSNTSAGGVVVVGLSLIALVTILKRIAG